MAFKLYTAVFLVILISLGLVNGGHRSKRYFFINPDAPITLGFLLNMPISLALPTLVDTSGREGEAAVDDAGDGDEDDPELYARSLKYSVDHSKLTDPKDLTWDVSYEEELDGLQVYFSYLKVKSVECQERMVCEFASNPDVYSPLSKLILKEIRQTHGPVKPSQDSLFWRFMAASATGFAYSEKECGVYYGSCPSSAKQMLNMPVLKVWQFLTSKLNLQLV